MAKKKQAKKKASKPAAKRKIAKKASTKKAVKKVAPKKKTAKKPTKKTAAKSAAKTSAPAPKKSRLKLAVDSVVSVVKKAAASMKPKTEILSAGSRAPEFSLANETGAMVSLRNFAGKTVVLYFYPKDDTPGCTKESCDFRDSFSRVQTAGAVVLGVSKDSVASHVKFKEKYSLPFSLLSDESGKVLEAYQVWKEKSMYGKTFMGIDRTTYLIDVDSAGNGTIRRAFAKVKVEGHVDEILKDLA